MAGFIAIETGTDTDLVTIVGTCVTLFIIVCTNYSIGAGRLHDPITAGRCL
jgi:hypothetical protein